MPERCDRTRDNFIVVRFVRAEVRNLRCAHVEVLCLAVIRDADMVMTDIRAEDTGLAVPAILKAPNARRQMLFVDHSSLSKKNKVQAL